jgi:hypothetical protein
MEESSMMTWMSSNVNIVTDTATKAKYITALEVAKELGVVHSVLVMWYGVDSFSPSSWEPQEEGMMNIAARFSLS